MMGPPLFARRCCIEDYSHAGSMFNHSSRPNVDYRVDVNQLIIRFSAARDILEGADHLRHVRAPYEPGGAGVL